MKLTLQTAAILPLLATSAVAGSNSVTCRTHLATKPYNPVPTTTVTKTSSVAPTVTKTIRPTVTKSVAHLYTVTVFTTDTISVTDTTVTDTFSTTTTVFDVDTETITSTVTTTATNTDQTSSTSTTTIATAANWKPIQDTIGSDTLDSGAQNRRGLEHPHAIRHSPRGAPKKDVKAFNYPAKVTCTKNLPNTKIKTVSKTVAPATKTVNYWETTTQTDTISSTTTIVPPDVSTTVTDTSTSSVTTYTTVFATNTDYVTTTTTSILPGPTVYDACGTDNQFGPGFTNNGKNYFAVNVANNGPGVGSDFMTVPDGASSAVDCCVACQQYDICETWIFRQRNRNCFLMSHAGASCPSQDNHPNYILSKQGTDNGAGYTVGNGNCGYTYSGNSDGSVFAPN